MSEMAVVGFGRFGELIAGLAGDEFSVKICENGSVRQQRAQDLGYRLISLPEIADVDLIVMAVPISAFTAVLEEAAPYIKANQVVTDVCSVKVHSAQQMRKLIPRAQTIATHPMFGPDSAARGLTDLRVAFSPVNASEAAQKMIRSFWEDRGVQVIETTPEAHDIDAAYSQAMPYIIAYALNQMSLPELTFTTRSSTALYDIAHYSAKDSKQLFEDMLSYNPYVAEMLEAFGGNMESVLAHAREIASSKVHTQE